MTTMNNEDPAAPEPLDQETEMEMLRAEVSNMMNHVMSYKAGNTELLELWLKLLDGQDIIDVQERVREILTGAGLLRDGAPDWKALEARRENRYTWAETVRALVKQPAEVARLLAMGDEA